MGVDRSTATFTRRGAMSVGVGAVLAGAGAAWAQDYPTKPVRLIVPYPPGGGADPLARNIGPKLSEKLRQPVVVENVAGAGGAIGTYRAASASPDGYTLALGNNQTHALNSALNPALSYHPIRDFAPISLLTIISHVLVVSASSPYRSVEDLAKASQSLPNGVSYGSPGNGSTAHLMGALWTRKGVKGLHIAYRGTGPVVNDVLGGQIVASFTTLPSVLGQISGGLLRGLAISTPERSPMLPDVPTLAELNLADINVESWYGLFAPAKTPPEVVARLSRDVAATLSDRDLRDRMEKLGYLLKGSSPNELRALVQADLDRSIELVKAFGITGD